MDFFTTKKVNETDEARKRKRNTDFRNILGLVSIGLGFLYVFLITFLEVPEQNQRFADTVLGVVISMVLTTVYNYFFGSSKGSSDKQRMIETNIKPEK